MTRSLWSLVAMVASSFALSGCAICEHCLDYDYPAFGGCCGWHADDYCRAGSAFCGMHAHDGFAAPPEIVEYSDAVPAPSSEPTPAEEPPPADLSPPSSRRLRPLGNEPLPRSETPEGQSPDLAPPAVPQLDLPPVDEAPEVDPLER